MYRWTQRAGETGGSLAVVVKCPIASEALRVVAVQCDGMTDGDVESHHHLSPCITLVRVLLEETVTWDRRCS